MFTLQDSLLYNVLCMVIVQFHCDQTILFTAQRWEDDPELKLLIKKAEPTGMQLGVGSYGSVEQVKVEGAVMQQRGPEFTRSSSQNFASCLVSTIPT